MSALTHCLATGQMIGSYQVVRPLGEGAMGEVYEVVDNTLDRHAALKVVPPWLANDKRVVARFRREVMATCQVRHPGVVHIFDYGVLPEQGSPYFVMEYLEGETLHTRIWRAAKQQPGGRLGLSCLNILRQIALALDAVHRHGLVHRDLKPGNVMLVTDPTAPGGEQAKLLDFGIVKILQGAEQTAEDSQDGTTMQGAILGTPRYMAPEQWQSGTKIDGKADVYALGVMAFLGISGQLPFVATDGPALGMMHCYMKAPSLAIKAPETPPEVVALVAQMLKKNPAKRPTMLEVAETLGRFISTHIPASASATTLGEDEVGANSGEILMEADYEPTISLNGYRVKPERSDLDMTQPLFPITQRPTRLMRPVPDTQDVPRVPNPTVVIEQTHETSESMLVGSSDNYKIDRGGSHWLAMGAALAVILCATYFLAGLRPASSVQNMLALQSAALPSPAASAPVAPLLTPPLLTPLLHPQPATPEIEPAPAPLAPQVKQPNLRVVPSSACIRRTNWSSEQQSELLRVFSRSHTRLYPKERLVLVNEADTPRLRRAPKSMTHRMRTNLIAELQRSREVFASSAPAYLPGQSSRIEVRCPILH